VLKLQRVLARAETPVNTGVQVLVADSGFDGVGTGIFNTNVLADSEQPSYADQVRPVLLPKGGPDWFHGTAVASLALGGPTFISTAVARGAVRLKIVQIYHISLLGNHTIVDTRQSLFSAIITRNPTALIVNLSLETKDPDPVSDLRPFLTDTNNQQLFVVAAGNDSAKLLPGAATPGVAIQRVATVYPAMMGETRKLITVAAWDSVRGDLAGFSNWGSDYVEIAAPGCYVPVLLPTLTKGWSTTRMSGTSMAAPLVSFTAALLRAYWGVGPADIKRRLLASADIVTSLSGGKIDDARLLNPIKALAIHEDIVKNCQNVEYFGKLSFNQGGRELKDNNVFDFKCIDGDHSIRVADILKIAPSFAGTNGQYTTRVYALADPNEERLMQRLYCQEPSDVVVRIQESGSLQVHSLLFSQIGDVVPHVR
jgi:hypothetical protein